MYQNKGRLSKSEIADLKERLFRNDSSRLRLNLLEDKRKYSNLLVQLSQILPEISKVLMKEMEKENCENILSEYEHLPWALRLLLELSTSDKRKPPNINLRTIHYKKKVVLRFFVLQMMYHIRNAKYSSPFTINISDIFYNMHDVLA